MNITAIFPCTYLFQYANSRKSWQLQDSVRVRWKSSVFDLKKVRNVQDTKVYLGKSRLMLIVDTNPFIRGMIKDHEIAAPDDWRVLRSFGVFGSHSQRKNCMLVPLKIAQVDLISYIN